MPSMLSAWVPRTVPVWAQFPTRNVTSLPESTPAVMSPEDSAPQNRW